MSRWCLSVCLSFFLSVCLSVCLSFFFLSVAQVRCRVCTWRMYETAFVHGPGTNGRPYTWQVQLYKILGVTVLGYLFKRKRVAALVPGPAKAPYMSMYECTNFRGSGGRRRASYGDRLMFSPHVRKAATVHAGGPRVRSYMYDRTWRVPHSQP